MSKPVTWQVGITTVPSRHGDLLPRTLDSLRAAGWDDFRLFVDGAAHPTAYHAPGIQHVTCREPAVGAFGNWVLALWELWVRNPLAHRYMIVQDDVLLLRNLRAYLDQLPMPERGCYWNLYAATRNEGAIHAVTSQGKRGWVEGALLRNPQNPELPHPDPKRLQCGLGALALVFSREGVVQVLSHLGTCWKPAHASRGKTQIDGAVVAAMNDGGWREWVHAPSLVQHLGTQTTIKRTVPAQATPAVSWPGATFDALDLLKRSEAPPLTLPDLTYAAR